MVERVYIVSKGVNEQNSTRPPTLIVQEREVNPKSYTWKWGFQGKTGWDWAQLLFVPLALGLLTLFVNDQAQKRERYALEERKSQEVVQDYLSKMIDLVSDGKLGQLSDKEKPELLQPTSTAAKALTQSVLGILSKDSPSILANDAKLRLEADNAGRKGQVLRFLYDSGLNTYNYSKYKKQLETKPESKPDSTIDMEGIELSGANLQNMSFGSDPQNQQRDGYQPDLSPINLGKAILIDANLSGSNLNKAYLQKARLSNADLQSTQLENADLQRANLVGANLAGANLTGADLSYADLTGADLTGANLSGSKTIHDAKLIHAKLKGAKLRDANLANAHLNEVDLTDADLTNANLNNAEIQEAIICNTTMPPGTVNSSNCLGQAN
ncbi:MAG: pentapeptide repeat-containing protein [Nostoc sp. TH1S01]|nr:pentapeptide repeat-containing protein [Nostoc sp. TH1S01]